jgi:phosphoglycolate phosphatase-like HAD superfamily hydrolase
MQAVILSERALADTDELFAAAVAHVVRKLGRVKPLDPETLPAARALTITALDLWAGSDVGNWRGELARYYEDHIPLRLRPDPALNAALRRLQTAGIRLACWSPGPDEAARIVVHHLGLGRRIERIAVGTSIGAAVGLADELAGSRDQALVVAEDTDALAAAVESGIGAAAAGWAGAGVVIAPPVATLATPNDLVELVLGETVTAR